MATFTVTITPTAVLTIGARWCIKGITRWMASAATTTLALAGQTIQFQHVEGYLKPADITITAGMITAGTTAAVYTATQWLAAWGTPMAGCLFKGQVLLGGRNFTTEQTFPSESRVVRWSEIGAFRFLGAGANALKNEAGSMYGTKASSETVMRILPMKDHVAIYTTMQVILLKPVSTPAPAYEVDELIDGIGILNPLAVASNSEGTKHVFLDKNGYLRELGIGTYGKISPKLVGYNHILGTLQSNFNMTTGVGCAVITYNPDEDEFYISNGVNSYLYNADGLTEIGVAISTFVNLKSTIIANELFTSASTKTLGNVTPLITDGYVYIETDIVDFNIAALKTIRQVEIAGSLGTSAVAYVMIKYRNDRSGSFVSTSWVRCSPNGVATPIVSGSDFKICLKMTPVDGVVINGITVEWSLTDKSSVRGNYASSSAT